ncbi:MAG: hypothetical protein KJO98_02595, partial [Rhodothermia bacterium]|nr:hypothetical protein [Rhodothermia bacterium]
HGSVRSDSIRSERLDQFFRRFVKNYNERLGLHWWRKVAAPPMLWTMSPESRYQRGDKITRMRITHVTSLYRRGDYSVVRSRPVKEYKFRTD